MKVTTMKVTTKVGDTGMSCLPTITEGDGRVSKGFLAFEVLGKIDQLDHDIQLAMTCLREYKSPVALSMLDKLQNHLIEDVRGLYSALLCTSEVDYASIFKEKTETLEKEGEQFECAYFGVTGQEMEADFGIVFTSFPALTIDQCRVSCRALERCLVNQTVNQPSQMGGKTLNYQEAVQPFVNRFSDWLYEAALLLEEFYKATR